MFKQDKAEAIRYADESELTTNGGIQHQMQVDAFLSGCMYKQNEISVLRNRLIKEAKSELSRKDARIKALEEECTRLFEPTRKFWDEDYRSQLEKVQEENSKLRACVEFYSDYKNDNPDNDWNNEYAIRVLKELGCSK